MFHLVTTLCIGITFVLNALRMAYMTFNEHWIKCITTTKVNFFLREAYMYLHARASGGGCPV